MGVFGDWDGSVAKARALQAELAKRVSLHDDFAEPRILAGFDVGFEEEGSITRAAVVLLDAGTLQPIESHIARVATSMQSPMLRSRSSADGPGQGVRSDTTQIAPARTPNKPASVSSTPASISQFRTRACCMSRMRASRWLGQ